MKKILLIDREAFLNWYFDEDIIEDFFYSQNVLKSLINNGEFKINAAELLDGVGYIPRFLACKNQSVKIDEFEEIMLDQYDQIKFA